MFIIFKQKAFLNTLIENYVYEYHYKILPVLAIDVNFLQS